MAGLNHPYHTIVTEKTMTKDELLARLVENALDFLMRSIEEFESHPKFSVIHFHAAVELFLKARLMAEHWSLVVTSRHEPDWDKFLAGDFISVSLTEAASKLDKIVRRGLRKEELDVLKDLTRHRNKMVHFFHEAHSPEKGHELLHSIAKQQLTAWYFLHKIIVNRWGDIFEPWAEKILAADKRLREHHTFLQVVFEQQRPEIERRIESGSIFETCASCGFEAQEHNPEIQQVYDSECLVCGLTELYLKIKCPECDETVRFAGDGFSECVSCGLRLEPEQIVDALTDPMAAYIAAKDGGDSGLPGNCGSCDSYRTVVELDDGTYFCCSCFEKFDSIDCCEWCNEPNTGDMVNSYWAGCNMCDGKAGWIRDDRD